MRQTYTYLFTILTTIFTNSCAPKLTELIPTEEEQTSNATRMEKLAIPAIFNFNTSTEVKFDIRALNNADKPIKGVVFSIYSTPENKLLFKGTSSVTGALSFV